MVRLNSERDVRQELARVRSRLEHLPLIHQDTAPAALHNARRAVLEQYARTLEEALSTARCG